MKTLLSAHAETKGGRGGRSVIEGGKLSFEMWMPGAPKKEGVTTNPEELFAAGYSACFGGAVDYVAKQKNIQIDGPMVKADVALNLDDAGGFFLAVTMNVEIPGVDAATAESLVHAAHQICPYSKATRGNIDVKLVVNNKPLSKAA